MARTACPIVLTLDERTELERRVRARTTPQQMVQRAQMILAAAAGARTQDIAASLGRVTHTVASWRTRFAKERVAG